MVRDENGLKDKVIGKAKEVEGKITGDKLRQFEGKTQVTKGKVKAKIHTTKKKLEKKRAKEVTQLCFTGYGY